MLVLCCSFCPLKIDYDYIGLESFNGIVDKCVFFDNGLVSRDIINSRIKVPIEWHDYTFTNYAKMRNDLIELVDPNDYVFMIDDTYAVNYNNILELKNYDAVAVNIKYPDKTLSAIKIFKASKYRYIVRYHEVIYPLETGLNVLESNITILDLQDEERSIEAIPNGIKLLKEDLDTFFQDNFLRTHIYYHLGISYYLIKKFKLSKTFLKKVLYSPPGSYYYKSAKLLINEL